MNNENPPGFAPSPFPELANIAAAEPKKRGGRRGPRQPKAAKPAKNGRRKKHSPNAKLLAETTRRARPLAQVAPQPGLKVDLATALAAFRGLSTIENHALAICWTNLAGLTKQERERVLAVLGKVTA